MGKDKEQPMIMPNNLRRGFERYQEEYEQKALEVLRSGWYVLGNEMESFEREWAGYCGSQYCVGLASGLDALWLAFKALGIGEGDEVIVQGNTYIASVMGITINGAIPVFVEPDKYYSIDASRIEEKITKRTKAILAVHLYGIPCEMDGITRICSRHNLKLVEDCAQSHGATYHGRTTGTFGDIGCFSFYPSKNLGAFGDAGAIITDNEQIAKDIRMYRNYGSERRYYNKAVGANSRLDELQAGLLRVKLGHLEELTRERERIAQRYLREIRNPFITLPEPRGTVEDGDRNVWHQFVIRCRHRDRLMEYLKEEGIGTLIHYPIPPHLSEAYGYLGHREGYLPITEGYAGEVLSIPMYNGMTDEEQEKVIGAMNNFKAVPCAG